jgi:hypothetical protein
MVRKRKGLLGGLFVALGAGFHPLVLSNNGLSNPDFGAVAAFCSIKSIIRCIFAALFTKT